jgi:pyridinium-3,5-bisthiocarboxylic acid mononucleotide nickel chelatase
MSQEFMKIGYLECFAGISGDMLLGALIDAGVSPDLLQQTAQGLGIGAELKIHHVDRSGIRSTKVDVLENGKLAETIWSSDSHEHSHSHDHDHEHQHSHKHGRTWAQIRELITHASILPEDARALALETFRLLAEAEGKIHGIPVDEVHFHEVGSVDTITDIVCSAVGVCSLKIDRWYSTDVNVGGGTIECAHGTFPVPAPATAELLKGIPTYSAGLKKELVTPTGAALLRALKCSYGEAPSMSTDAIGYGAGSRNPEKLPNVLRISIGEGRELAVSSGAKTDTVTVLECAIDDASPQVLAHAMELALENGALDVMAAPVTMKKGRLGTLLTVLAKPEDGTALEALLFRETTTIGIRRRVEERSILDRSFETVETAFGKIRVKIASANGEQRNAMPEYEDCRRAAREHGAPLKTVMDAALLAFSESKARA